MNTVFWIVEGALACVLMGHWFCWAPLGRAGPNPEDPWPVFQHGGLRENIGHIVFEIAMVVALVWIDRVRLRKSQREAN